MRRNRLIFYFIFKKLYYDVHFVLKLLKIWFDIITPKQILFHESFVDRLRKKHTVFCTTRNYREATQLAKIRNFKIKTIGKHGGQQISSKLDAGIKRMHILSQQIQKFNPDVTISSCSPDASRISYGLGIPHIGFSNIPHYEAQMKLSAPFLTKLLIPFHIPKIKFTKYGIHSKDIIQYNAMDEFLIINNKKISSSKLPRMKLNKKKTILFRTYELQAAYIHHHTDVYKIIDSLIKNFADYNLLILGRYANEIETLKKKYSNQDIIVFDKVVDSQTILSLVDLFIGSGGTMTTEAVLSGIPSISYDASPNLDAEYLIKKKLLVRAKTPNQITFHAKKLLSKETSSFKLKTQKFTAAMNDPYHILLSTIQSIKNSS